MPKLPKLPKGLKDTGEAAEPAEKKSAPRAASGGAAPLARIAQHPRSTWLITGIAAVVVILLVVIIGLISGIQTAPAPAPSETPAASEAPSQAEVLEPTLTADALLADMEGGTLTWNGSGMTYGEPKATISNGGVTASASYVDADVAIQQAVALAKVVFTDPALTSLRFESIGSSGTAVITIVFNSELTPVATLEGLESGSPEEAYKSARSYSLTADVQSANGYSIPISGGSSAATSAAATSA